ncbi:hypothetical protein TNCV_1216331 [Trichonephila clavipes]|nr:hypothetical protein TNCV_1216331 [Trichonephila clavipes]
MTPVLAPHSPNFHTTPMQSFLVSDTFSVNRANAPFVENGAEELSTFVMEPFQFQEGIFAVELVLITFRNPVKPLFSCSENIWPILFHQQII